jgi:hypothetical protein
MLVLVGTGLLVGLPVVPLLGRDAVDEYRWLALVLPCSRCPDPAAAEPGFGRGPAGGQAAAAAGPAVTDRGPAGRRWAVLSWLCYGPTCFLLARRLGTDGGALLWLQCTGAFAAPSPAV